MKERTSSRINILVAGQKLFAKKGFYETTVTEITKKANTGKGTFYLYFRDKEHLLFSIFEEGLNNLLSRLKKRTYLSLDTIRKIEKRHY